MSAVIAEWQSALPVFLRRCLVVGGLTVLAFGGFGIVSGFWQIMLAMPVLIVAYVFLFDDHLRWFSIRHDRWQLTPTHLVHLGQDGESRVPLDQIDETATRFGWTVIVTLGSGLTLEMPYMRDPGKIAAQILAARDGMAGQQADMTRQDRTE